MTTEQKEAIDRLNFHKDFAQIPNNCAIVNVDDIKILLNLIQEQEKFLLYDKNKLERFKKLLILKEKMIYIITKKLKETALITEACGYKISDDIDYRVSIELIIKEFERKVEGESNDKSTYGK